MSPLNPFLRAFFRSTLPAQCNPVQSHILLVPTTEILLTSRDRDSNTLFADLAGSEEFLGSHVLRVPGSPLGPPTRDGGSARELKAKAKQFSTFNGRTVVIKDSHVYSNKGFKNVNQAQIVNDTLFYPDTADAQQWLVYYISRPLVGSLEHVITVPAVVPVTERSSMSPRVNGVKKPSIPSEQLPAKKDITSFSGLMNEFPMIARQMHPGLEEIFNEFHTTLDDSALVPHTNEASSNSIDMDGQQPASEAQRISEAGKLPEQLHPANGQTSAPHTRNDYFADDGEHMRRTLETAIISTIELFQSVDKQQLSLLGATTDLTGPIVERLIERYVTEQLHLSVLFPSICALRRLDDRELESKIRQMESLDVSQVGIAVIGGREGKQELTDRLDKGVAEFRKMGVADGPQAMLQILLATEKAIAMIRNDKSQAEAVTGEENEQESIEKSKSVLAINADTLVSLLLIVVIRAQVRHLHARLFYMRQFIFIDDVEAGESGYALSTFEAVLSYLVKDSAGLRRASRKNKSLWEATRLGDVEVIKGILEPREAGDLGIQSSDGAVSETGSDEEGSLSPTVGSVELERPTSSGSLAHRNERLDRWRRGSLTLGDAAEPMPTPLSTGLRHVFPFQVNDKASSEPNGVIDQPTRTKRVSLDTHSVSSSSAHSLLSRTMTIDSCGSGFEGDTSTERLALTHDFSGASLLMMSIEHNQAAALRYLLTLDSHYPAEIVFDDRNNEGTTLLSAGIQLGHREQIEVLLEFICHCGDEAAIKAYFARRDTRGRTAGHYLFNTPELVETLGQWVPWRMRDKNGQTPLFALCRSYDQPQYYEMIRQAISAATASQEDHLSLHLDDHIDAKGNTLLHVVNEPRLASYLLAHCDSDPNATNDKRFTPLMVASKYGRVDLVRVFFSDARVDLFAKELRGFTAIELAKDDEVRNKIDDLILFSNGRDEAGRTTAVVRSFFVEDASIRLVLKSAVPLSNSTITITTCRRSIVDFENLAKWLSIEHPASWLPTIKDSRSPFQIPSRPSRAMLREHQQRFDHFIKLLLVHSTFGNHEMLWEFLLVPEMSPEMLAERSKKKAEARAERVKEEYEPVDDVREVEVFVSHARDTVQGVQRASKNVTRRVNMVKTIETDLSDAFELASRAFSKLSFLPDAHGEALRRYAATIVPTDGSPHILLHSDFLSICSTIVAMLQALGRPQTLIVSMGQASKAIDRHMSAVRRSDRWPLGLLDDTRNRLHQEAAEKVEQSRRELLGLASELRYTQQTVAGELAAWQDLQETMGRRALLRLAKRTVILERARLESMKRAMRGVLKGI